MFMHFEFDIIRVHVFTGFDRKRSPVSKATGKAITKKASQRFVYSATRTRTCVAAVSSFRDTHTHTPTRTRHQHITASTVYICCRRVCYVLVCSSDSISLLCYQSAACITDPCVHVVMYPQLLFSDVWVLACWCAGMYVRRVVRYWSRAHTHGRSARVCDFSWMRLTGTRSANGRESWIASHEIVRVQCGGELIDGRPVLGGCFQCPPLQ